MDFQFTGELVANHNKLWSQHVCIPEEITQYFLSIKNKRVWCTVLNGEPFQCAITPIGVGFYVIKINKGLMKKHKLELGHKVELTLSEDTSKHGLPMPEALEAVIKEHEQGDELFYNLSEGKRRTLLYIVGQGATQDKQIERSWIIMQHLENNNGKIDYKLLHQKIAGGL